MAKKAREQVAALPVSLGGAGRPHVMLLTSRGTGRWVIPKGWPIPGLTPRDAAAREAYEEAGLVGTVVHEQPIGAYRYDKRLASGRTVTCRVAVYLFRVDRQLGVWPEKAQRRTRWFAPAEAAALVAEAELAALLLGVGARDDAVSAAWTPAARASGAEPPVHTHGV